jgi:hypothetical protein
MPQTHQQQLQQQPQQWYTELSGAAAISSFVFIELTF